MAIQRQKNGVRICRNTFLDIRNIYYHRGINDRFSRKETVERFNVAEEIFLVFGFFELFVSCGGGPQREVVQSIRVGTELIGLYKVFYGVDTGFGVSLTH